MNPNYHKVRRRKQPDMAIRSPRDHVVDAASSDLSVSGDGRHGEGGEASHGVTQGDHHQALPEGLARLRTGRLYNTWYNSW